MKHLTSIVLFALMCVFISGCGQSDSRHLVLSFEEAGIQDYSKKEWNEFCAEVQRYLRSIDFDAEITDVIITRIPDGYKATLIFESPLTKIPHKALFCWQGLSSASIPDTVTEIEYDPSFPKNSLKKLEGKNVSADGCCLIVDGRLIAMATAGLSECRIPDSVTEIGEGVFARRDNLLSVNIPNSVTKIGKSAFWGCHYLTSVNIPDSVTEIGEYAFVNCRSLTSVNIPSSVTKIGESAFSGCSSLISVNIPDSVIEIGDGAFNNCKSLTSVNIPDSVIEIGRNPFSDCPSLKKFEGKNVSADGRCLIVDGRLIAMATAGLSECRIPDSVTEIGEGVFARRDNLLSVNIPNSVTKIGARAFSGCSSLTSVNIPDSVTEIGAWAFSGCSSLTSVSLPTGVKFDRESTFPQHTKIEYR